MTNVLKLPIFTLMDILLWDNSENGYKKEKNGKYEPESKKHQKHGQSSESDMGHKKSTSPKKLEEEDEGENMGNRGQGPVGNKHNRGY